MMMMLLITIGSVLGGFILIGTQLSISAGKRAALMLAEMEHKYQDYVEKYFALSILDHHAQIDYEDLLHNVQKILKPDIEGLLAHINKVNLSDVNIKSHLQVFSNVARLAESLYNKRHSAQQMLGEADFNKLLEGLRDALEADLTRRMLNLKAGSI